jgi:hypothetical protein
MNYFDSDMSNSTNTVVYFDRKAVMSHTIYGAKFEQTITHQHVPLRRESQSHILLRRERQSHILLRRESQSHILLRRASQSY